MIACEPDVDSLVHILPDHIVDPAIVICGRLLSRCGDAIGFASRSGGCGLRRYRLGGV